MNIPDNPQFPGNSRDFALNKWGYTRVDVTSLIDRISQADVRTKEELELALREGGGKAFGLKICEQIASNFAFMPYKMVVPKWKIVKDIKTAKLEFGFILRSSAETEDWLDGRSGTLRSFSGNSSDVLAFNFLKREKKLPENPFLLQTYERGWGLVVDIGYSALLDKVLVRIAAGNERFISGLMYRGERGTFTSATKDTEASLGVWEAETGAPVLPTRNFGHKSIHPDNREYYNVIARPLYNAVRRTGIDFGVQLELIEHPDRSFVLQLVQIRPTPTKVYQPISIVRSSTEEHSLRERIIARSSVVNGAFDVTGEAFFFGEKGIGDNFGMGRLENSRLMGGKVGIYDSSSGDDPAYTLQYHMAAPVYFGGYLAGSDVQLTPVAIRPNTHHGSMTNPSEYDQVYNLLDQHCGMVSLRATEIDRIKAIAEQSGKPLRLRVVSDGLLAQVRLMD